MKTTLMSTNFNYEFSNTKKFIGSLYSEELKIRNGIENTSFNFKESVTNKIYLSDVNYVKIQYRGKKNAVPYMTTFKSEFSQGKETLIIDKKYMKVDYIEFYDVSALALKEVVLDKLLGMKDTVSIMINNVLYVKNGVI